MIEHSALLLGGTGFLGRALACELIAERWKIGVLSRHSPHIPIPGAKIHQASLDNTDTLKALLPHYQTIIHLASTTTPGSSAHSPEQEVEQNILPTIRFLEILRGFTSRRLVYVSSGGTLYGNPDALPVNEDQPLNPLSNHGAGKVAIEHFLHIYALQHKGCITVLRPSNIYGPGQPLKSNFGIIRTMLEHIRQGTNMELWGDGETVRDFLFITDWVDACMHLLSLNAPTGTFNIGSSTGHSLNTLQTIVETVTGHTLRVTRKPFRSIDVRGVVLDTTRLTTATGWTPRITLEAGIRKTWDWVRQL